MADDAPTPPARAPAPGGKASLLTPLVCTAAVAAALAFLFHRFGSEALDSYGGSASLFHWLRIQYQFPDMQFTWIMPLVALYAIWDARAELAAEPKRTSVAGVIFTALVLAGHIVAFRAEQPRLSLFAMAFATWGSCWALWGRRVAYRLLFPLGYVLLSFLCYHITHYTTSLQVAASRLAVVLLRGFGLEARHVGSVIQVALGASVPPLTFNVAEGCSGLRSLVVLSALAAPYAYFRVRGNLRAWILFAMSVPLAVFTNILRISTLTLFARLFGRDLSLQIYHDPAGFLVFFIAIVLLQATAAILERDWGSVARRLLARLRHRPEDTPGDEPDAAPPPSPVIRLHPDSVAVLATQAVLLLLVSLTAATLARPRHFTGNPDAPVTLELPADLGPYHGEPLLFCSNDQCFRDYRRSDFPDGDGPFSCPVCSNALDTIGIGERRLLPPGTPIVRRLYSAKGRPDVQVTAVFAGIDRSAIHRPQHCLRSQGHEVIDEHDHSVPLPDGRRRSLHVLDTVRRYKNDAGRTVSSGFLYAYWYFNPERETSDNLRRILRTGADSVLRSYRPRWAYLSIGLACDPDRRDDAYRTVDEIVERIDPVISAYQRSAKAAETAPPSP